jgi:hypothetical protein
MEKQFAYAGVSRKCGKLKIRWANSADRTKQLEQDLQTDIQLIELPCTMTKRAAVQWLWANAFAVTPEITVLLCKYLGEAVPQQAAPRAMRLLTGPVRPLLLTYQPQRLRNARGHFVKITG